MAGSTTAEINKRVITDFPLHAKAVTPSANVLTDYDGDVQWMVIYVGVAGTVTVVPLGNDDADTVVYTVPAGGVVPCRVRKVTAATAGSLVGQW